MSVKIKLNSNKILLNSDSVYLYGGKYWDFLETSANSTLYPSPRSVIVAGASGCATTTEGLNGLEAVFPAANETLFQYGRVTVFDGANPCNYFHWYIVRAG